jgi:hypothetical protein
MLGGQALIDWFGHVPSFHDAEILEIALNSRGPSTLRLHTWRLTDEVDGRGFFVLDRHAVVTVTLTAVRRAAISNFDLPGIISSLDISKIEIGTEYTRTEMGTQWTSSYGVEGTLTARGVRFDLQPGNP